MVTQPKLSDRAIKVINEFGDSVSFLRQNNPNLQTQTALYKERAFTSDKSPTIGAVREAYGEKVCNSWLFNQLEVINDFAGVKSKLTEGQMKELAGMLQAEIFWMKISEFMYFLHQLKMGKYGSFYGVVDGMKITESLGKFIKERRDYIFQLEEEIKKEKRKDMFKGTITREQYDKLKKRAKIDINAFMELFPNSNKSDWEEWRKC